MQTLYLLQLLTAYSTKPHYLYMKPSKWYTNFFSIEMIPPVNKKAGSRNHLRT